VALSEQEEFELLSLEREKAIGGAPQEAGVKYHPSIDYNPAVAQAEATAALGSGMVAAPAGGLAGLLGSMLPGQSGQGARWSQAVQQALSYEPRTQGGQKLTGMVAAPFEALAGVADKAGGAVTDLTGSPMIGTATNTAIQGLPMAIGKVVPKVAGVVRAKPNPALAAAADAGFKTTPQEAGGGIVSQTAASLANEPRLARKIANENAGKAQDLVAQDLGLPKGTVLTHDVIDGVIEREGAAYQRLRKAGRVEIDEPFRKDLGKVIEDWQGAAEDFPRKSNPVMEVYERLTQNEDGSPKLGFNANSGVSEIKNLRKDAGKAFRSGDAELGKANLAAAEAMEDIFDRHMSKPTVGSDGAGVPGDAYAMNGFREARKRIAKAYDAQKALVGDGQINPQAYAKLADKGRPLSGGAKEIAEAAKNFPRSMAKPSAQATGPQILDALPSLLNEKYLGLLFARPIARSILASDPYQNMFLRNRGGIREALSSSAFSNTTTPALLAMLAKVHREAPALAPESDGVLAEYSAPRRGAPMAMMAGGTR
jgi:hypothetical protein